MWSQFSFVLILMTLSLGSGDEQSLEDIMKELLRIKPPIGEFSFNMQSPPKHMLELYHRFTSGYRATGETVRSIQPTFSASHQMLEFNISHMEPDEEIRLSQLVLRRRRLARHPHQIQHRKLLAPPYRVRLYQIISAGDGSRMKPRTVPLASIPVAQVSRGGWHSLDVTSAIRELRFTHPSSHNLIIGVRFEAPRSKILAPGYFLNEKNDSSAFLMIYSDQISKSKQSNKQNTQKHIELLSKHLEHHNRRHKNNENLMNEVLKTKITKRVIRSVHARRSIMDNELPYEKLHLNSSGSNKMEMKHVENVSKNKDEDYDENSYIPYPPGMGRKNKRKGRHGKRKKHRSRSTQIPNEWRKGHPNNVNNLQSEANVSYKQFCSKRNLSVNFKELGWSNWIIAPKSFESNYCTGSCNWPLAESLPKTNHAIIQGLVHHFNNDIPAPCCVPNKLMPLSVLYITANAQVVLKNYPNMVTKSCGCR